MSDQCTWCKVELTEKDIDSNTKKYYSHSVTPDGFVILAGPQPKDTQHPPLCSECYFNV